MRNSVTRKTPAPDGWVTQLRKGLMELCILRLLRGGESYGYAIVRAMNDHPALSVSESTVYPVLARLKAEGALSVRDVPSPAGPPRRYFSLSARGRARLVELNAYWKQMTAAVEELHPLAKETPS